MESEIVIAGAVQVPTMYMTREGAASHLALSVSNFDKMVQAKELPAARKLSKGRVGWLRREIEAWGEARPVSDLLPPVNSGYGRAGKPA